MRNLLTSKLGNGIIIPSKLGKEAIMKKEEILAASRKENKNIDFAELEANRYAGSIASSVGVFICALISLLASTVADVMLYSPWAIYFSMMCANWLVKAIKLKRKSNWIVALMFLILSVLAFVGLVERLSEGAL